MALGYVRVDQVEDAGEFSVRGGLIDVFPATERYPVRVEFWGDEVDTLRSFSVFSQRSLGPLDKVRLHAAAEDPEEAPANLLTLLPEGTRVVRLDPARGRARVEAFESELVDVLGASYAGDEYEGWPQVEERLAELPVITFDSLGMAAAEAETLDEVPTFRAGSGELPVTNLPEAEEAMRRLVDDGYRVVIAFEQRAEAERAGFVLRRTTGTLVHGGEVEAGPGVSFLPAPLRRHFLIPEIKLALLTDAQVFPRRHKAAAARRPTPGVSLSSFRDLRKGDFVVHEDHGVGRFEGISTKTVAGVTRDYLDLAYKDGDMLYIPHDQIGKVMRYVGAGGSAPSLSKLGGKAWEHIKSRVRKAARQVAGELLHLYALRQATKGFAFSEDNEWQVRFEKAFPYEETEDQLRAIDAIKDDMESERPMDRLLCGDVGYGKTEVALRAAFKAVQDRKQVLVLVPTTILAQQHYGTFRERMAEFPVKVEMISRFRSAAEQKKIINDFGAGKVDILIGTHRLLSEDVRPKDLGLVIVDEEQRFGVAQKEALRRLKLRVDVLTLTATPIPRTLQMSLSGVRDITVIETPPRDRHPIQTYVGLLDEGMVKRAIEREIDRGGQVYYLHNRVETIDKAAMKLRTAMPEVRFGVGHGQMAEQELERVMLEFLRGDAGRAGEHHHHRERAGHPQRQHARRGAGRPAGAVAALPDPGPHRAVHPGGARLPLPSRRGGAHRGSGGPPLHPGRLHRAGLGLQDRHARPGDPRRRRAAGGGAVRPDRGGGLRDVPVHAGRGHAAVGGRGSAARGEVRAGGHRHRRARAADIHRLRGGQGGPAPAHRLGEVPGGADRPAGGARRPFRGASRARRQPHLPGRGAGAGAGPRRRFPVGAPGPGHRERAHAAARGRANACASGTAATSTPRCRGSCRSGYRGEARSAREVVQAVLDDILPLSTGEVVSDR